MLVFGIISLLPTRAFFMLKFYILMSDPAGIFRHFSPHYSGLLPSEVEIVINTKDSTKERDLVHLCQLYQVKYHVTESNGKAGKGKNELLKIFLESDNQYCVQIDGDDYLTPHGVQFYKNIVKGKRVPDAICLAHQGGLTLVGKSYDLKPVTTRMFSMGKEEVKHLDWDKTRAKLRCTVETEELVERYTEYHKRFYETQVKYCEEGDTHNRVVFYSRKAAEHTKFAESIAIGEDTLHFLYLKDAHMKGELEVVVNIEYPCTYVYNRLDSNGTVYKHTKGLSNWEWMGAFNEQVRTLEDLGLLHEDPLPHVFVSYNEIPNMEDFGLNGPKRYEQHGVGIDLPAHASDSCISNLIFKYGRTIQK